jgi:hypothetical protein
MAWRFARSLAELQRFDPEDVFSRYLEWHRQGSYDTGAVAQLSSIMRLPEWSAKWRGT